MATGDTYTDLGTKLKIATGKPATEDQVGYGALTWVEIGGVVSLPERGDTSEDITEPTLRDGRNEHFNGLIDGGELAIPMKFIEADAGQAIILANATSNTTYSFQEVDIDGEAHFYYGRIGQLVRREATTSSNKGNIATVRVNSGRFTGTEES